MPNLRQSVIEQFWQKKDPRMARILGWMESMEDWMLDDDEDVAEKIYSLASSLERADKEDIIDNSEHLIKVMAYMSSPRSLRLLEWFDSQYADETSVVIIKSAEEMGDDACGKILIDRLQTLQRLNLLSRIFSPSRSRVVAEILNEAHDRDA